MSGYINQAKWQTKDIGFSKIYFYGDLPKRKCIYISSSSKSGKENRKYLYSSALEAAMMDIDVAFIPSGGISDPIENGVLDGEGRYHIILPKGLLRAHRKTISRAILFGGSVISGTLEKDFSIENLVLAKYIASTIADSLVIGERVSDSQYGYYILNMIDDGKDVAVLKSSLGSKFLNSLVTEGCPAINSFSDFMINPSCFVYPSDKGRYSQDGFCFDIIKYGE